MNALTTIQQIEFRNREQRRHPDFALFREIHKELPELSVEQLRDELRQLITKGAIKWGNTINDTYFTSI